VQPADVRGIDCRSQGRATISRKKERHNSALNRIRTSDSSVPAEQDLTRYSCGLHTHTHTHTHKLELSVITLQLLVPELPTRICGDVNYQTHNHRSSITNVAPISTACYTPSFCIDLALYTSHTNTPKQQLHSTVL
jgi:hypothetical protein